MPRAWLTVGGLVVAGLFVALPFQAAPVEPIPHFREHAPAVISHGGAQAYAPANTIPAFELALELGADTLEMDLQLTADREVVVIHDGTVDRTTEGAGAVADMTLAELKELDAGHAFEGPDGGHPYRGTDVEIPTLEEVFAAFPETFLIVELKTDGGPEIADEVAERIRAHDRQGHVAVASFSVEYLQRFRRLVPDVPTNMPEGELRDLYILQLVGLDRWWTPPGELLQVPEIHEGRRVVTAGFVDAAHRLGADVQVWTVNDPEDMHRLLNLGVDGIMTDAPDRLVAVLEARAAGEGPAAADDHPGMSVVRTLQDAASWLTPIAEGVTALGDEEFYLLVFPLLYWSVRRRLGAQLGVMLLLSVGLNEVLKLGFHTPRPNHLDPTVGLRHETSFGLPSGHAQNAVAVWGLLAAQLRSRVWWAAAGVLILALGWSRLQLGVHLPQDTLAGFGFGAVLLAAFLYWRRPVARWFVARSPARQVWLAFGGSLVLIAVGVAARLTLVDWVIPAGWIGVDPAEPPGSLAGVVTPAAALFGFAAGLVFLGQRGGFDTAGSVGRRALRYPVGLVGVVVLWAGLEAVFPAGFDPVALVYRYVRYAATGFWIGGLAPLVFVRAGLAPAGPDPPRGPRGADR